MTECVLFCQANNKKSVLFQNLLGQILSSYNNMTVYTDLYAEKCSFLYLKRMKLLAMLGIMYLIGIVFFLFGHAVVVVRDVRSLVYICS